MCIAVYIYISLVPQILIPETKYGAMRFKTYQDNVINLSIPVD